MMFANDDDMVECPYNNSHRMLRKRLQSHLLKCRVHYPDVELRKCPFNLSHLIPEPEFTHHVTNCSDRKLITQYKYDAPEVVEEDIPKHAPIESEENWDETDVPDYDPTKYVEKAAVIRLPVGTAPSERKEFIKKERKRLGDIDSDEENEAEEEVQAMELPNTILRQRMRSETPEQIYRNRSPPPASRNGSGAYNCDKDPYYSRYIEERSNRSSLSGDNCDPPLRSCRGDRSPSGSYKYRSTSSKHRDRSPLNNHQNRSSSRTYRDRSPSRNHRDRSPFRKHK